MARQVKNTSCFYSLGPGRFLERFGASSVVWKMIMKLFEMRDIVAAKDYSMQGGQALHIHTINTGHPLFKRYPVIGHLFDQDKDRLIATARKLGVRVIKIDREGEPGQHIDLCGKPYDRAYETALNGAQLSFPN